MCEPRGVIVRSSAALLRAAALLATLLATTGASARNGGIAAEGCEGCHSTGKAPSITIDYLPKVANPGDTITINVGISGVNGPVGGLYLLTNGRGKLSTVEAQGTRLVDFAQMVHSTPKRASSDGVVRFSVKWTAPAMPTGLTLSVFGVSGNGDGRSGGDGAAEARTSFAVGCAGKTYWRDWDADGFGGLETVVDCSKPPGFVDAGGDCDDNDPKVHSGAAERCNNKDDNCDGTIDENLVAMTQYEDKDGDGYGKVTGMTVVAKCPPAGYAPAAGDCDDNDPLVHPGAVDVCNHKDDNCNGRVDERVRPRRGVGMCLREAPTCEPDTCEPGRPTIEKCNGLDDDCDGDVDEGELCGVGKICFEAVCVDAPPDGTLPGSDAGTSDGVGSGAATLSGCAFALARQRRATSLAPAALVMFTLLRRRRSRRSGSHRSLRR